MIEPRIRKPAKKAFHFPKNGSGLASADEKQADVPDAVTTDTQAAPTKTKKPKRALAVDATPTGGAVEEKVKRVKKEKVVRDSFTMPKSDCDKIAALKQTCLDAGVPVRRSGLLRAGLILLEAAPAKRLLAAISAVDTVKTGRPAKS